MRALAARRLRVGLPTRYRQPEEIVADLVHIEWGT